MTSLTATENLNNNPTVSKSGGVAATSTVVSVKEAVSSTKPLSAPDNGQELSSDLILTQQFADCKGNKVPNDVRLTSDVQKVKEIKDNATSQQVLDVRKIIARRASSPFQNGRTELLIGTEDNKFKTTAIVESNNNKLKIDQEVRLVFKWKTTQLHIVPYL